MHAEITLIKDYAIIFIIAIIVILAFNRLRMPPIVGFLITGVITGPYGLGLVQGVEGVEVMAEIGIVLLLFTIGIEFSLENLLKIKKLIFFGGLLQAGITVAVVGFISVKFDIALNEAVFFGFLAALSSTAIIFKIMQDRSEVSSAHGQLLLAILIFQDIIIILMILLTPIIAGQSTNIGYALAILGAKTIGVIFMIFWGFKWIIPKLLFHIVRLRNSEVFLMTVFGLCFGIAWLTSSIGLSLAFGAFLAGLIISESEYSNQAFGYILPFKDLLSSIFFVSIGMLLDISFLFHNIQTVILLVLGIICVKAVIAIGSGVIMRYHISTAIVAGIMLGQIGEFSFVLARLGTEYGFLEGSLYQLFLAVSIITMAVTPFLSEGAEVAGRLTAKLRLPAILRKEPLPSADAAPPGLNNHVVIIGFGVNGKNVARAAKSSKIPYIIIEMNPQTVRTERAKGEPIFYGDATRELILKHAGIREAKVAVIVIFDPAATERITETIKRMNPSVHLIVRTRFLGEVNKLYELGANEVIPEEFETSVEIFARVLAAYLIPRSEIDLLVSEIRAGGYEMLRSISVDSASLSKLRIHIPDIELCSIRVPESSALTGGTLRNLEIRKKYGINVIAIFRDGNLIDSPSGDDRIENDDILYILGRHANIATFKSLV